MYVFKCHELGMVPSSQVVSQLRQPESTMAHCQLGRYGAKALRHALMANTVITSLNLEDNSLDALVCCWVCVWRYRTGWLAG